MADMPLDDLVYWAKKAATMQARINGAVD